jgi:hypothetical protein
VSATIAIVAIGISAPSWQGLSYSETPVVLQRQSGPAEQAVDYAEFKQHAARVITIDVQVAFTSTGFSQVVIHESLRLSSTDPFS